VVVAPEGSELGNLVGTVVQKPDVVSAATAGALGLEDLGDGGIVLEGLDGEDFVNGAVNGELSHGRQAVEVFASDALILHHGWCIQQGGAVAICNVPPLTAHRLLPQLPAYAAPAYATLDSSPPFQPAPLLQP
jgi:hypothetical protein